MKVSVRRATTLMDVIEFERIMQPIRTPKAEGLMPINFDLMKDRIKFSEKKNIELLKETFVAERISKTPMRNNNRRIALPSLLPKLEMGPNSTKNSS